MKRPFLIWAVAALVSAAAQAFGQSATARIASPANKARYASCSALPIAVETTASGTTVSKVEVWENGVRIRNLTKAPFQFNRTGLPDGIYQYVAKAVPAAGDTAVSDTVTVFMGGVREGNLIFNGDFNCGAAPWRLDFYVNAQATFTVVPDLGLTADSAGALVEIQNVGDAAWAVQLMQPFKLKKGHTYEIRFTAETSEPKDISVDISMDYDPYGQHWTQPVTVSQWGVYGPYTFECGVDDPKTMFKFVLGGNKIPISIDAVEVIDQMWTDVKSEGAPAVRSFSLAPNYPNPFNPETTIPYILERGGKVRFSICNSVGETVSRFEGNQPAGSHFYRWNGLDSRGLPARSGLYVCRLEMEGRTLSSKMMLVR
jgi:hypothetical protein